jgi:predicted ATP-dependent endonuclease of OLD family
MLTRMRIKKIMVDGYKNLRNCEVDFSDFNVLVGPNNSGKSNFLEIFLFTRAMIYASDDFRKEIFENGIAPRGDSIVCYEDMEADGGCRPIRINFLIESTINGHKWDVNYRFQIQCKFYGKPKGLKKSEIGFIVEELTLKDTKKTGRAVTLIKRNKNIMMVRSKANNLMNQKIRSFNSCLQIVPSIYPDFEGLDNGFPVAFDAIDKLVDTRTISLSPEHLREKIGSKSDLTDLKITSFDLPNETAKIAKDKKLFMEFKNALCQILDFENVSLSSAEQPQKGDSKKKKIVHFLELKAPNQPYSLIGDFSDGTLMVTAILDCILSPNRKGFLINIEEPENCLHPKALKTLVSYLKQKSNQIQFIVTTHSTYLLNNVSPEDVIIARIKKDGSDFKRIENIRELRKRLSHGFISFGDLLYVDFGEDNI